MHGQEGHGPFCSFLPIIFFALQGAPPDASSMSATGEKGGKEDYGQKTALGGTSSDQVAVCHALSSSSESSGQKVSRPP